MDLAAFWMRTSGTWLNAGAVLLGTVVGLLLAGKLPAPMRAIMIQGVGLVTLVIGFGMARSLEDGGSGRIDGVVLGLLAVVGGGVIGEWWRLEERLEALGERLKTRFGGGGGFGEGFVAASLLFCVGPLTLIGSLNNGLSGDATLLTIKATLDGLSAVALAGAYGAGVGLAIPVILLYQGGVSLAAGALAGGLPDPAHDARVLLVSGVGGVLVIGLGINLLGLTRIRVASFLPALALAPILHGLAALVG
jgi:uncharacterized membrane protein YqgA involved in biofilm formation